MKNICSVFRDKEVDNVEMPVENSQMQWGESIIPGDDINFIDIGVFIRVFKDSILSNALVSFHHFARRNGESAPLHLAFLSRRP
jgi:hypothetical protein